MKFSIKDFFSKCDQIHRKLQIWSHLLKRPLMENFIFCVVYRLIYSFIWLSPHLFKTAVLRKKLSRKSKRKVIRLNKKAKNNVCKGDTVQKKFSVKDFFSKCGQIRIKIFKYVLQSNLSIKEILYSWHLVIADIFPKNRPNHGQSLNRKPLYRGHFYSGQLLLRAQLFGTVWKVYFNGQPIFLVGK